MLIEISSTNKKISILRKTNLFLNYNILPFTIILKQKPFQICKFVIFKLLVILVLLIIIIKANSRSLTKK